MNGSIPFATEQRSECWAAISGETIGERDVTRSPSQPLPRASVRAPTGLHPERFSCFGATPNL